MSPNLIVLWHLFQQVAPWLVVSGIPSIIVGLSSHPSSTNNKIVAALKVILNALSVLSHADSAGTFKYPFTQSRAPGANPRPNMPAAPSSFPTAALLAGLAFAGLVAGCTAAQSAAWKKIGISIGLDCGSALATGSVADALSDIQAAASGTSVDPAAAATAIAEKNGIAAAMCAAGKLIAGAGTLIGAEASPSPQVAISKAILALGKK